MKTVISVIAILLALLLAGCTNTEAKTPQPSDVSEVAAESEKISEPIHTQKLTGEKEGYEDYLFDTPNSTCFSRIGYIEKSEILVVEFRESGSIYEYSGFTADDWDSFSSADSLGGYFNQKIKGNFPYERIY